MKTSKLTRRFLMVLVLATLAGCMSGSEPPATRSSSLTERFDLAVVRSEWQDNGDIVTSVMDLGEEGLFATAYWTASTNELWLALPDAYVEPLAGTAEEMSLEEANSSAYEWFLAMRARHSEQPHSLRNPPLPYGYLPVPYGCRIISCSEYTNEGYFRIFDTSGACWSYACGNYNTYTCGDGFNCDGQAL